jgi:ribonuclease BN (tRNA processing enzyme)
LAKDADLLIHMCFYISGTFRRKGRASVCGHLEVADIAARANAKAVVASHFSPQFEPPGVFEKCIAEMSRVYSGRIIWGEDLMELSLHPPEAKEVG